MSGSTGNRHRTAFRWLLGVLFLISGPVIGQAQIAPVDGSDVGMIPVVGDLAMAESLLDAPTPVEPLGTPAAEPLPTAEAIEALTRRLEELEAEVKKSSAKKDDSQKKDDGKKDEAKSDDGDWTDMSTDKWNVRLGGHVQMDLINWAQASESIVGDQDYFEFRRIRLLAEGTGYGVYDFRLQMTLEPEAVGETLPLGTVTTPEVKDAYFSINDIPWLGRFRIGNFFVPFGLEQVTNDTFNIFLERSIPTQGIFTPDREVGMAIYNATPDQNLSWAYGISLDSISESLKERVDDNQGYRLSGRVNWVPYFDEPTNGRYAIHTGAGVLYTQDNDNRVRFRARPQIHEGPRLIDSGILNAGSYTIGNIESALVMGRVTIQSEAYLTNVNLTTAESVNIGGAYVHGSYFLTGESRTYERFGQHGAQFGRNVPFSNFFIVPGGWSPGAVELKARWSLLNLNAVNEGQYNDFTFGFNWYLSDRTRMMFDWIHPFTTSETPFGTTQSDIIGMRWDFNW